MTNFCDEFLRRIFVKYTKFFNLDKDTFDYLTITSFRIGVPTILFLVKIIIIFGRKCQMSYPKNIKNNLKVYA